jgi:hypothetical protein
VREDRSEWLHVLDAERRGPLQTADLRGDGGGKDRSAACPRQGKPERRSTPRNDVRKYDALVYRDIGDPPKADRREPPLSGAP